jgi:hypothetical protein
MNHGNLITQLVVGEPRAVPIGRPVKKPLVAATHMALRWKQGRWIAPAPVLLTRLRDALGRRAARAIVILGTANSGFPGGSCSSGAPARIPTKAPRSKGD